MEGVILIRKRMMFWRGVSVFGRFWGAKKIIILFDKRENCEIFSSEITLELVALDLDGIDLL